jgi:hypothetical protein
VADKPNEQGVRLLEIHYTAMLTLNALCVWMKAQTMVLACILYAVMLELYCALHSGVADL